MRYNPAVIQTIDDLTQGAVALPPDQRFTLARRILASVEPGVDPVVDEAWAAVIGERIRKYDAGQTDGVPAADVFAGVDRRLAL